MKAIGIAVGIVVLGFAVVAGSVLALGDEMILVSPPDVVAEEFVRAVAGKRAAAARSMLTRDAQRTTSDSAMRTLSTTFRARFGNLDDVRADIVERRNDTMLVRADIEGERGRSDALVPLLREYGEWSVARASAVIPDSSKASHAP